MKAIFNDNRASLQGELEGEKQSVQIINKGNAEATNGAAMKIWPAAVLHPGDIDAAIDCALQICRFTHNNVLAMSGAAAMAAANQRGVKSADQCRQHYCRRYLRCAKGLSAGAGARGDDGGRSFRCPTH
ncbi:ADP-ribosylglycohydrolase [Salmonella enterica subsp. enterica]|uniref:ADP-ribosylglycohydrolase n=1 Tax=Salmonella enterica I TaxID=59201 RepID=A0A447N0F6_SALET|nr:ADP-ribosylglycohydrolase [Salmonella enterica subsp. enterica]